MPDDYGPAIKHLLMLVADPDRPNEDLAEVLLEFDTEDACVQLAVETARAAAIRTPYRLRTTGPLTTEDCAALVLVSVARKDPRALPDTLRDMYDGNLQRLSGITISALRVYRGVCRDLTRHTIATLEVPERPLTGPLRLQNGARALPGHPTPQTGAHDA